ncbi:MULTISPECIES: zinc-binding dehydrogenase [unclassified Bradyrhizobium]|uniref:zinc-binding dehydrogenase n=1 Tax=unclassified Bradyrhizobium TaxID=2631580 RepID=UPI00211EE536|nr:MULTISPECIES: zinc-binding dehydrogenase [unclassified Bradyrhizobium]MDD1535678.1 NADH oxidase [Bradyrhizobium sp. WBOS8]MDD1583194.1 NADH oxidase [Bradyrhizobium sp. WBOS4]UUO49160.1 NADH oxidase [Bradyrhizobium sp. WBOS04]UUO62973.1 NADH oxidase [Bradyrhizobium sp. WBOS08]
MSDGKSGLQLRSLLKKSGELELSLVEVPTPEPADDEVVVRVEASPINPSDLGLLIGPADMLAAKASGTKEMPVITATMPEAAMGMMGGRLDQSLPVGNEGAGTVIRTGASDAAKALMGKTVSMIGGAMYTQYRVLKVRDVMELPAGTTAADGASWFVNPLTALGMTETMRRENHKALVHTAAASNLGQMLNKICIKDGIGLVNIVRSEEQADILRKIGAKYIVDSSAPSFTDDLTNALVETGATIAFDAIGGGKLASQILTAMEVAANKTAKEYSRYGSNVYKQVYIYGSLDNRPTELSRSFGLTWGVGGWLLTPFLQKIGPAEIGRLRQRVASELKTTFASHYTKVVSLAEALDPANIAVYAKRATGEKFLINPNK